MKVMKTMTIKVYTICACWGEEVDHAVIGKIYTRREEACEVKKQLEAVNEEYEFEIIEHDLEVDA